MPGGGNGEPTPVIRPMPAPMNVVFRKDAERAVRVAYATGRRDAMLALSLEMKALAGQFIAVDDMTEAIEKAAEEFTALIEAHERGEVPPSDQTPEQTAAEKARERIILPS